MIKMKFNILTLFPEFFKSPLEVSIIGRAIESGLVEVNTVNIRDFVEGSDKSPSEDKRLIVDDSPYGGGAGMVLKAQPVVSAIESVRGDSKEGASSGGGSKRPAKVVLLTPQGATFTQSIAKELAKEDELVLVCGRYEGFDERIREFVDMELSLGNFVLTGGEPVALTVIDAVARLKEGVIGTSESLRDESFASSSSSKLGGLLEYPQYTRPEEFRGLKVPKVLMSGNHKEIEKWRRQESIKRTVTRRPDIIDELESDLSEEDKKILEEIKNNKK